MSTTVYHLTPTLDVSHYEIRDTSTPVPYAVTVKGKLPKQGQRVRVTDKHGNTQHGRVYSVNHEGVPVRVELDTGVIIELLNLIIELVGLVGRLWLAIKSLFKKW